ncbi:M28 family peptidase [Tardiphaga sp.]|uniref:M28 family peptidase n=1 Tax=Tardiphaga sp. TaxID=1926292 RepID=UPI0025F6F0AA|nr:M28 family peptidase [Tardiphaga sp.]
MRIVLTVPLAALLIAAAPPPTPQTLKLRAIVADVDILRLRADVSALVGFGTRHTLSSQTTPERGIGAALTWGEAEFTLYSRMCGNCLVTARPSTTVSGDRVPTPTKLTDVIAIQRGTERPNDVVIITGHIDSRVSDVMNATADAPGANDDGSGSAAVLETARVLSQHKFPGTIVYALLSGEEQGLYGGKLLADYAKAQGWNVVANLNNDIIGNSCGSDGVCDAKTVRVFSEGPRWQGREALAKAQRSLGGENDSPSRNISRFLDDLADRLAIGLDVRQIWRNDRFGRGGDHTEFLNAGFPAIRFSVAVENYNQQHQDLRTEKGVVYGDTIEAMDFAYLTKVVKLNAAALAALASAPPPPEPSVEGAVSTNTTVKWPLVREADHYVIKWRRTDLSQWRSETTVFVGAGPEVALISCIRSEVGPNRQRVGVDCSTAVTLHPIRVDDWVFGVSSISKDGWESPVASAVPGGAFKPYVAPPAAK